MSGCTTGISVRGASRFKTFSTPTGRLFTRSEYGFPPPDFWAMNFNTKVWSKRPSNTVFGLTKGEITNSDSQCAKSFGVAGVCRRSGGNRRQGWRSTVIALNPRRHGSKWPKARYRRQMKRRFHRRKYGQRWQCESVHSRIKRRLGSSLSGRSHASRKREALVKVLTHNLSILRPHRISTEQSHLINVDFCTCTFVLDV